MSTIKQADKYGIIGESQGIQGVFDIVGKAAGSDSTVMVFGESGTGKELIARALHQNSPRKDKPFIAVNCGAIPHELLESELFGYEKGAFTGAANTRIGRVELANEGTIFLDEIGDMPTALQVKLLRVLAEREIDRLGGTKPVKIDVRFITATHRNLEEAIKEGKFREDLYYRLNIIPLVIPPLRDRKNDIPLLAQHFLNKCSENQGKEPKTISSEAMQILVNYSWPGNIRELGNFVERMVVLSVGNTITPRDLPEKVLGEVPRENLPPITEPEYEQSPPQMLQNGLQQSFFMGLPEDGINLKSVVEDFERGLILEALEKTNWVKNKAAGLLQLNRTTLVEKIKKMKIQR
ncbi:MAG TPA: RNA polymerase subunit sigma-54 [Nitrospina sp.]|jgi:DNA-binding NtrC family response regulator|nr:sigma-54 dependent transcriptional regulator [Nitrospinaceae bacterium]MDP7148894.1 sigma-54 dependent transcriptional regulator [Nitrospinaceae bacterium]HAX46561.1 RNA polymerase subunit sigma-54 [Nitrospina sp.]|tara:strand:+ start:4577 stop:5626 length:1050 start_codon:yes stop_codon:yes gene_type:complete